MPHNFSITSAMETQNPNPSGPNDVSVLIMGTVDGNPITVIFQKPDLQAAFASGGGPAVRTLIAQRMLAGVLAQVAPISVASPLVVSGNFAQ